MNLVRTVEPIGFDNDIEHADKMRIKAGFDPTGPDLHLGHLVLLNKLKDFQDDGHEIVIIIGDFTASIGDPSGKNKTRPTLEATEINSNSILITKQILTILDPNKTEVRRNSEWLGELSAAALVKLMSSTTVSKMLSRKDFRTRFNNNIPIALHELTYPLLQGLDSVEVRADVEVGGIDQLFNLNMGRELQSLNGLKKQVIITMPIINGLCGSNKMSKTLNNHISLSDSAEDIFGKTMSISDALMHDWIDALGLDIADDHPMKRKKKLALKNVSMIHNHEAAIVAQAEFEAKFSKQQIPANIKSANISDNFLNTCREFSGISGSELIRLVKQGGIRVNNIKINDINIRPVGGDIVAIGKRIMFKIT